MRISATALLGVLLLSATGPSTVTAIPSPAPFGAAKAASQQLAERAVTSFFGMSPAELKGLVKCFLNRGKEGIQEEIKEVTDKLTCGACTGALKLFTKALTLDDTLTNIGKWVCTTFNIFEPEEICEGIIPQFIPWFKEVFQNPRFGDAERRQFCHSQADLCPAEPSTFVPTLPRLASNVSLVAPVSTAASGVRYIVHLSDIHLDIFYAEGAESDCKAFLCCRKDSVSGKGPGIVKPCGPYGTFTSDTPVALARSAFRAIKQAVPKIDAVIITGDLVPHNLWETSKDKVFEELEVAINLIKAELPGVQVIPAIGNHDTAPTNYWAPTDLSGYTRAPVGTTYAPTKDAYAKTASLYASWLPKEAIESVKRNGVYAFSPFKGLKVLSVNTNYCYTQDYWSYLNYNTPNVDSVLSWIVSELTAAERAGEAVWVIGHHSPGTKDCLENWSNGFYQIVKRFSPHVLAGLFYGHLHTDTFEVFYADERNRTAANAVNVAYVSPSLAPYTNLNPGFRVYAVDARTHRVLDAYTYIAPEFETTPASADLRWTLEYSARTAYAAANPGRGDLDAAFWHRVTDRMEEGGDVFDKYHAFRFKSANVPACDEKCRKDSVCRVRAGKSELSCGKAGRSNL
ncbi:hypothetical protein HDU96_003563 [Phlyctochytrium bullatum]|nr:hypothetical protein HDU96_003563 [Phlyctochytrium bullatum]